MSERFTEVTSKVKWYNDNETGLEWSETAPYRMTFTEAIEWCGSVGGRLPTIYELLTLVDYNELCPCTEIPATQIAIYWSSTPYAGSSAQAWFLSFEDGRSNHEYRTVTLLVRAVRKAS